MSEELDTLRASIQETASAHGLTVFDGEPDVSRLASVAWRGDWMTFVGLAKQAGATLLYLHEDRYDPDQVILQQSHDPSLIPDESADQVTSTEATSEREDKAWLYARIRERIAVWDARRNEVTGLSCIWVKDHVAHHWRCYADWIFECRDTIDAVLEEAEEISREDRVLRSQETAHKLYECAVQMAHHPRFSEASNDDKREFMAQQLFPEMASDDPLGRRTAMSIAKRASLIYWWDVAPTEKVMKAQRARALYAQGDSIRNIASVLKMSDAKVRAAINEVS
jgi:hypothetical protein